MQHKDLVILVRQYEIVPYSLHGSNTDYMDHVTCTIDIVPMSDVIENHI